MSGPTSLIQQAVQFTPPPTSEQYTTLPCKASSASMEECVITPWADAARAATTLRAISTPVVIPHRAVTSISTVTQVTHPAPVSTSAAYHETVAAVRGTVQNQSSACGGNVAARRVKTEAGQVVGTHVAVNEVGGTHVRNGGRNAVQQHDSGGVNTKGTKVSSRDVVERGDVAGSDELQVVQVSKRATNTSTRQAAQNESPSRRYRQPSSPNVQKQQQQVQRTERTEAQLRKVSKGTFSPQNVQHAEIIDIDSESNPNNACRKPINRQTLQIETVHARDLANVKKLEQNYGIVRVEETDGVTKWIGCRFCGEFGMGGSRGVQVWKAPFLVKEIEKHVQGHKEWGLFWEGKVEFGERSAGCRIMYKQRIRDMQIAIPKKSLIVVERVRDMPRGKRGRERNAGVGEGAVNAGRVKKRKRKRGRKKRLNGRGEV